MRSALTITTTFLLASFLPTSGSAATIYSTVPNPLPPGVTSVSEQANGLSRIGDLIQFSATPPGITLATVVLSDYAYQSAYAGVGTSAGFNDLVQLNLYNKNVDGTVGSLLASRSVNASVPWQPEPGGGCTTPGAYRASDGSCYLGKTFGVTFNFGSIALPSQIIYGVSYSTSTLGPSPYGTPGPYDKVNFGFTNSSPSVGSDPAPLVTYLDFGSGFGPNTGVGLDGFTGIVSFDTVPEPSTMVLFSLAGAIAFAKRRAFATTKR